MKIHLKFDHTKEDVLDAIDCQVDSEQVDYLIRAVMKRYDEDESICKSSQMAELIHNQLDYEIILFLATKAIEHKMMNLALEELAKGFRKFLRDEDI
jgi:hypothetical protein